MARANVLFILAISGSLAGCAAFANAPNYPERTSADILQIQRIAETELYDAYTKNGKLNGWLKGWRYSALLELERTKTINLTPSLGIKDSLGSIAGQFFKIGLEANGETETFREGQVNFSGKLAGVRKYEDDSDLRTLFKGNIGVAEWLEKVSQTAIRLQNSANGAKLGQLSSVIRFTYTENGSVNPTFTLLPVQIDELTPAATLKAARKRLYSLTLTLDPPPGPTSATEVILDDTSINEVKRAVTLAILEARSTELKVDVQPSRDEQPSQRESGTSAPTATQQNKINKELAKELEKQMRKLRPTRPQTSTRQTDVFTERDRRSLERTNRSISRDNEFVQ